MENAECRMGDDSREAVLPSPFSILHSPFAVMIQMTLQSGEFMSILQSLRERSQRPRALLQAAGMGVRKLLQAHFKTRDQTANKLGGDRTHFWLDVYKSTQMGEVTDRSATVLVGDARFAAKVKDTTILPGKGLSSKTGAATKFLAIPVDPMAHGRRPAVFESKFGLQLFPVMTGKKKAAIGLATAGPGDIFVMRYLFARAAHVKADPFALPPQPAIEDAALTAAKNQFATEGPKT
jgi:hypothetical protein